VVGRLADRAPGFRGGPALRVPAGAVAAHDLLRQQLHHPLQLTAATGS
jgi:hypothetical protein